MYLIGLTGNIASGKSTVRRMLQEQGARVIDTDALAHAVLLPGTPGWRAVVEGFGLEVVAPSGHIDRAKLGAVVFADPARLKELEAIVHPAVAAQLALLLREARAEIVVVEAVKLIEAGLDRYCDAVWVVTTSPQEAERRLMEERGLSRAEAQLRLAAQPPLADKLRRANVVIDNRGSLVATRVQVMRALAAIDPARGSDKREAIAALLGLAPAGASSPEPHSVASEPPGVQSAAETAPGARVSVRRARPGDALVLGKLLGGEGGSAPLAREEVLRRFGLWGYWLAEEGGQVRAMAAWRAENLVAVVRDLWAESPEAARLVYPPLFDAILAEAQALSCEVVALITGAASDRDARPALLAAGFQVRSLESLHPHWKGVARSELREGETLYIKPLRERMVNSPV